jgi:hypothetical protein
MLEKAFVALSGGNCRNQVDGKIIPRESVRLRLQIAYEEWKKDGEKSLIITTTLYSPNLPPLLDDDGFPVSEAEAMASYLIQLGVPAKLIRMDQNSVCTLSNLYFVSRICQAYEICQLVLVTSQFHSLKTNRLADYIFHLTDSPIRLYYIICSENGSEFKDVEDRMIKEKKALSETLKRLDNFRSSGVKTLDDLFKYLLETHDYYMVGRQPRRMTREKGEKIGY